MLVPYNNLTAPKRNISSARLFMVANITKRVALRYAPVVGETR